MSCGGGECRRWRSERAVSCDPHPLAVAHPEEGGPPGSGVLPAIACAQARPDLIRSTVRQTP